ncbi:MAG TPA: UDP-N-acetylmuramoyl-tripeptide--D-alanyl-D-alanine ligase [Mycobacteriales bacterium]|nr:UDP-N-acetylmuramoyl-tripeptide--D-alanyl-D-alanine ligase [Mycobacteriales bacterium]
MLSLRADEIAALTGGRLDHVDPATVVDGPVVIDSREAGPGMMFVALAGEHEDGHRYVGDARRRGVPLVLTARPVDEPAVVVDDVAKALGFLAGGVLRRTPGVRVCGVTGSSGKTSTKDLIASLLHHHGPTVAARGSFNNEIGLPLTVLGVDAETEYLVLEYSARNVGHIAYLTGIARPEIAVVLNVGSAHLGEFGSREAIALAKGELVEALPADGVAILNLDDPLVAPMALRTSAEVVGFGETDAATIRIADVTVDDEARPRFRLVTESGEANVALSVHGRHQVGNAAAAAAVGLSFGMSLNEVVEELGSATAQSAHRMAVQRRADGLLVVDDAYNANPESMRAAIEALVGLATSRDGASWAVVGEMRELGEESAGLHRATGRAAASLGVDHLVVVGEVAAEVGEGARGVAGWSGTCTAVATADDAVAALGAARASDVVLVKASNAIGLWRVAEQLVGGVGAHR